MLHTLSVNAAPVLPGVFVFALGECVVLLVVAWQAVQQQVQIESVFEDENCVAIVDPNQLTTAILNLALNARDAMPGGGKLILETGVAYLDEVYASANDMPPGHYVLIAVSDTQTSSGRPAFAWIMMGRSATER